MGRIYDSRRSEFTDDHSEFLTDNYKVTGIFWSDENEILDVVIGEVTLPNRLDLPDEIEINGITYKKES